MTNQIPTIILKPGKERALLRRHPWVYATGVSKVLGKPKSGETVRIQDSKGKFLAWGAFSPESALRARCWSFQEEDVINAAWIEARVKAAIEARSCLRSRTNAIRLIFGEADFLPGLIVDQYNNQVVTQFQSAGAEYWRSEIGQALVKYTGCSQVYDRSDAATRAREGLPNARRSLRAKSRLRKSKSWKTESNTASTSAWAIKPVFTLTSATTALWPADLPKNSRKFTAEA